MRAYVGIGANIGDAVQTVRAAAERLRPLGLRHLSSLYRSEPIDSTGPDFVNAVAELDCSLAPLELLQALQAIEHDFGRQRPYRNAPRTLDLDLLLHGEERLDGEVLTLPHPRLHQRAFVLRPLLELAPDLIAPGLGPLADHLPAVVGQRLERMNE
jgi:2-amino-4-hydroxy-6-hydroxymethyldihydropteridine diphosphokinase